MGLGENRRSVNVMINSILKRLRVMRRPKLLLGVDYSDHELRIVALRRLAKESQAEGSVAEDSLAVPASLRYELEGYAVASLPAGTVVAGEIADSEQLAKHLRRIVKKLRVQNRRVACAIRTSEALILTMTVDKELSRRQRDDRVIAMAENALPYSLDEIYLDFATAAGGDDEASESQRITDTEEVFVVAGQLDSIDRRVECFSAANLEIEVADVAALAQERALAPLIAHFAEGDTVLLLTLEQGLSSLALFRNGRHIATREWQYGENSQPDALVEAPALVRETAFIWEEKDPRENGGFASLRAAVSEQKNLLFAQANVERDLIDCVFLAGSEVRREGLEPAIAAALGCRVKVADPFFGIGLPTNFDPATVYQDAPGLLLASALAQREALP